MEKNKIYQGNCIELMKELEDYSVDIVLTDPPYALGSEVIIRPDGKPDYKKAIDFMNKWEQPDGKFWEEYFKEAYRILKHGGRVIMFGMDRQCMLNKYYACASGFIEQQSLYWYFISNFPKSADLSKNLMKYYGDEGEETGEIKTHAQKGVAIAEERGAIGGGAFGEAREEKLTRPTHPIAQKYSGYKYSIAPLKQTCETIMIFQKPYKTGSALHDVLAYESGDNQCLCGALDVDGNRVPTTETWETTADDIRGGNFKNDENKRHPTLIKHSHENGRYPSQTYCDIETATILDKQSEYNDVGGCSKILHKCDYDTKDFDLYIYEPKVDSNERNMCMEDREEFEAQRHKVAVIQTKGVANEGILEDGKQLSGLNKNNHPTVKPIALMTKILKLFKTPNQQIILDTFAGSGSTLISAKHLGIDWIGFEINTEYVRITKARMSQSTLLGEWKNE